MEDVMEDNSVVLYFAGSGDNESDDDGDVFNDIDDDEGTTITTAANETSIVEVKSLDELTVIITHDDDNDDNDNTSMTNNIDPIDDVDSNYTTTVAAAAAISSRISLILAATGSSPAAVVDEGTSSLASSSSSSSLTHGLDNIIQNNNYIVECQQEITRMKQLLAVPAPSVGTDVQQITADDDTGFVHQSSHSHQVSKNKKLEQKQQHTLLLSSPPPAEEKDNEHEAPNSMVESRATTTVSLGGGDGNTQQDIPRQVMVVEVQKQTLDQDDAAFFSSERESTITANATATDLQSRRGRRRSKHEGPVDLDEIYGQEEEYARVFRPPTFLPIESVVVSGSTNAKEVYPNMYEQKISHESFDTGTDLSSWDAADEAAAPDTSPAVNDSSSTGKTNKNTRKPVPTVQLNTVRDSSAFSSSKPLLRLVRPTRDGIVDPNNGSIDIIHNNNNNIVKGQKGEENHNDDEWVVGVNEVSIVNSYIRLARPTRDDIVIGTSPVAVAAPATATDPNNGLHIIHSNNNRDEGQKGKENNNDERVVGVHESSIVNSCEDPEKVVADADDNSTANNPIDADSTIPNTTTAAAAVISSSRSSDSFLASSYVVDDSLSGTNANEVYQKIYEQGSSHENFDTGTDFSWDTADDAAPDNTSPAVDGGSSSAGTNTNRKSVPTLKFHKIRDFSSSVLSPTPLRLARPNRDGIVIGTSPVAAPAPATDPNNGSIDIINTNNIVVEGQQKGEEKNNNDERVVDGNEISSVNSYDEPEEVVADDDDNSTTNYPIDADSSSSNSFLASSVVDDSWSLASSTLAIPIPPLEQQQKQPNNGMDIIHNNYVIEEGQQKGDTEKSNKDEWVVGILNETCSTVQSEEDSFVFDDDSSSSSSSSSLPPIPPPPDTHHHHHHHHPEQQQQQDNGSVDIIHKNNNVVEEEDQKREELEDFSSSFLSSLPTAIPPRLDEQLQQHRQQRQQRQQQQLDNGIAIIHKNNVVKKGQNIKEIDDFSSLLLSSLPARIPPLLDKQQQQQQQRQQQQQQQHNGIDIIHKNNNVVEETQNREELDDFLSSCLSSLPAIQSLDIQQQQQQQQQQQNNGIIDDFSSSLLASLPVIFPLLDKQQQQQILTNTNRVFKPGQPKKGEESTINDDERVVGINATSGLEEDCRRRALRGSQARHLRALRIRCANGGDICDNSTVQIANNTNKDNYQEKTKVLIENDPLVDTQITADDYREELLLARSLRSNRDRSRSRSRSRSRRLRRNYTNSKSNKSPVLSSVECSTPEKISEELNTLLESSCKASTEVVDYSCKASTEMVDYGCGIMTAATNTLELFFIGFKSTTTACAATTTACAAPTAAATTSTNDIVTTKEIAAYNNTMQATTAHHDVTMNEIEIVTTEELAAYQNIQEIATTNLVIIAP